MTKPPIDATRLFLRTLRLVDDGRRAAEAGWRRLTQSQEAAQASRRQPPQPW